MTKKETMIVVHVRLTESQINALDAIAKNKMGSRCQEIRMALHEHLKHYPNLYPVKDRPVEEESDD